MKHIGSENIILGKKQQTKKSYWGKSEREQEYKNKKSSIIASAYIKKSKLNYIILLTIN